MNVRVIDRLDKRVRDVAKNIIIRDNFPNLIFSEDPESRKDALEILLEYLSDLDYYFLGDNQIFVKLKDKSLLYVMDVPKECQGKLAYMIER